MNIIILSPSLDTRINVSGISTVVKQIIETNNEQKYYHYLVGSSDQQTNILLWFILLIKQIFFFPFKLQKHNIELAHINIPFDSKGVLRDSIFVFWCWLFKVKILLHIHGGKFLTFKCKNIFIKFLIRKILSCSNKVLTLSVLESIKLSEMYGDHSSIVLSNSVSISNCTKINKSIDIPIFIYLGRIEKNKGIYELIEAFKLAYPINRFKFLLCGNGPLKDTFVNECENIFGNDFEYKGIVFGDKKNNVITISDYFLLPSYFEGLPMALIETMAAGVIPIVTNVGSISDVVTENVNGFFVKKYDAIDLANKINYVVENKDQLLNLSLNAQNTINEKYNLKHYIVNLNKIYNMINKNSQLQF